MDKKYYYRMLGLAASDPTPKQIKEAYERRMAKLNSSDYDDDRQYAQKKMREATMAYRVLTGASPSVTKTQKRDYFERFKDAMENREGNDDSGRAEIDSGMAAYKRSREREKRAEGRSSKAQAGGFGSSFESIKNAGNKKVVIGVVIAATVAVIIGGGFLFGNLADFLSEKLAAYEPGYQYEEESVEALTAEEISEIEAVGEKMVGVDYYSMLDTSVREQYVDYVDWTEGIEEYGDDAMFNGIFNLSYNMGIYNVSGFYDYVTGEPEYYFYYDDRDCADTLINWMGAPAFDEVAGSVNEYTGAPILSISEYLEYLSSLVLNIGG